MSHPLRRSWRLLIAVLLLLALPLQAAELARMGICPPAAMVAMDLHGGASDQDAPHDAHPDHHDRAQAPAHDLAQDHHATSEPGSHAHQGSGCCKTCLAGCSGWVVAAPAVWPAPDWTATRYPRLNSTTPPEPLARGLERPPRNPSA